MEVGDAMGDAADVDPAIVGWEEKLRVE